MDASQQMRVKQLLEELAERSPQDRAELLASVQRQDADVHAAVVQQLNHQESQNSVPSSSPVSEMRRDERPMHNDGADPLIGKQIGPFWIIEHLGGGGFGTVYKAEQRRPIKRTVALKIIKLGFDTREVIARFNSERQALARMDHPNIARVLDAGTTESGRPYFAMEYVAGVCITRFADENRLSVRDRLLLFLQVCDAVAHAHQKAIIHRDIKSTNVLAFLRDGKAHAKVIDFGIAKALTSDRLTDLTFNTVTGMVIGTYEAMSPEQASGSPDIDTRTDIYSLGVLLYELLTGVPPFDRQMMTRSSHGEACRIIRDVEPTRPSSKFHTSHQAARVAELRQSDVPTLSRELRRELEWIPLKALRKERERRYRSVQEMAGDVQNYLQGLPLIAGPENRAYRIRKFIWQNRQLAAAVSSVILILVICIGVITNLAVQATRAKAAADRSNRELKIETANKTAAYAKADELLGMAALQSAKLLRNQHEFFPAAMTAAYAVGFTGDTTGPTDVPTPARLRPDSKAWNEAVDLSLMPAGHLMWRRLGNEHGRASFIKFDPSGSRLVSAGLDGTIQIWEAASGSIIQSPRCHLNGVRGVSFNRTATSLQIICNNGKSLMRWDLAKDLAAEPCDLFSAPDHPVGQPEAHFGFSQDGSALISSLGNASVLMSEWSQQGSPIRLEPLPYEIQSVAVNRDGSQWAVALKDNSIQVFSNRGKSWFPLPRCSDFATSMVFSPDDRCLATGSRDGTIRVFDLNTRQAVHEMQGTDASIDALTFNSSGRVLASGAGDATIRMWDAATGESIETLRGSADAITSVSFSPDDGALAWAARDGAIGVWDVKSYKPLNTLAAHEGWVSSVCINAEGDRLASASYDKTVVLWELPDGKLLHRFSDAQLPMFNVCFRPGAHALAGGSADGTVRMWDSLHYQLLHTFGEVDLKMDTGEQSHGVLCTAFSPDGKYLAAGSRDGRIVIWNADTGQEAGRILLANDSAQSICFSSDASRLFIGSYDRKIRTYDWRNKSELLTFKGHAEKVTAVDLSPDGKLLASGSKDGTIRFWNPGTGAELTSALLSPGKPVTSIQFNRAGDRLVSGSEDSFVRIWDVKNFTLLQTMHGHRSGVYGVCFAPDGNTLASGSDDRTVNVWKILTNVPLRQYLSAYEFDGIELLPKPVINPFKAKTAAELQAQKNQGTEK